MSVLFAKHAHMPYPVNRPLLWPRPFLATRIGIARPDDAMSHPARVTPLGRWS